MKAPKLTKVQRVDQEQEARRAKNKAAADLGQEFADQGFDAWHDSTGPEGMVSFHLSDARVLLAAWRSLTDAGRAALKEPS